MCILGCESLATGLKVAEVDLWQEAWCKMVQLRVILSIKSLVDAPLMFEAHVKFETGQWKEVNKI